ncbi:MAG: hypothetical protein LBB58_01010 [Cellulomonadaceae bacterium]|jgi:hypothetical protein|nr:hypothetical protein [Cellulomonadaceae bacterium]
MKRKLRASQIMAPAAALGLLAVTYGAGIASAEPGPLLRDEPIFDLRVDLATGEIVKVERPRHAPAEAPTYIAPRWPDGAEISDQLPSPHLPISDPITTTTQ